MSSVALSFISAIALAGNSVVASQIFKNEDRVSGSLTSAISFFPAFLIALLFLPLVWEQASLPLIAQLFCKDCLYGLAFYIRFEGLKRLGPFLGAVLLGAQPIFVAVTSFLLLGENLTALQVLSLAVTAGGLYFLSKTNKKGTLAMKDVFQLLFAPSLLMGLVATLDRKVLAGQLTGSVFFILDKALLLPAFLFTLCLLGRRKQIQPKKVFPAFVENRQLFGRMILILGGLWLVSSLTYGLALQAEKATVVIVIRNLSYPLAALCSVIFFKEVFGRVRLLGFVFTTIGASIAAL